MIYDSENIDKNLLRYQLMYRASANSTQFLKSIAKNNNNNQERQTKPKYSLNEIQKDFIAAQLPKGYSFTLASDIDQKRQRIPKKTDEFFQIEYPKADFRRDVQDKKNQKRDEKRENKKAKQISQTHTLIHHERLQEKKTDDEVKKKADQKQNEKSNEEKILLFEDKNKNVSFCTITENKKEAHRQVEGKIKSNSKQKTKTLESNDNQQQMRTRKEREKANVKNIIENCSSEVGLKGEVKNDCASLIGQANLSRELTSQQKQYFTRLISKLKGHKSSWPFRIPVDPVTQGVPNYLKVIHEPMDLRTIEKKLFSLKYEHIGEIMGDINKIFLNSYKFNPKQCQYYALTVELEAYFHQLLKSKQDKLAQDGEKLGKMKEKQQPKNQQYPHEQLTQGKKRKIQTPVKDTKDGAASVNKMGDEQQHLQVIQKRGEKSKRKPKYSDHFKKQLMKRIEKLSSRSIEMIVQIAMGRLEQQNATVELDFEKISDQNIEKICLIAQTQFEKNEQSKINMIPPETRFSLF